MSVIVIPYQAEHLMAMSLQESQQWMTRDLTYEGAKSLEGESLTWTHNGAVLMVAGVSMYWRGRGYVWSFMMPEAKRYWKSIHKSVLRWREHWPRRVEASVAYGPGFEERCRLLEHLGFTVMTDRAVAFLEDGTDCRLYERVVA